MIVVVGLLRLPVSAVHGSLAVLGSALHPLKHFVLRVVNGS